MTRRLSIAATLGALLLCAETAPALTQQGSPPRAQDFGVTLPRAAPIAVEGGAQAAAARARWISPPVTAPKSFDLVGMAREPRSLEIRVRDRGGQWSDWVHQEDGTPIYVDGARIAQVRATFRPRGRLHFVKVSGSSRTSGKSVASASGGRAAGMPPVVPRATWGADLPGGCLPRGPAEYGSVNAGVIHHTVNANDYTREEAAGIVLGICRFHVSGNGWNDIGYNALVDRYGTIYEGRAGGLEFPVVGAHAQGFNDQTASVASIGEHSSQKITKAARNAIINFLAWKLQVSLATPANGTILLTSGGGSQSRYPSGTPVTVQRVIGHGTLGLTECPGTTLAAAQVSKIAAAVHKRITGVGTKKKKKKRKGKKKGKRKNRASGGSIPVLP